MKFLIPVFAILFLLWGCGKNEEAPSSVGHKQQDAPGRLAKQPIIFTNSTSKNSYSVQLQNERDLISIEVKNNSMAPLFIAGDPVIGMTTKQPSLHLAMKNNQGQQLEKCGHFEVPINRMQPIVIKANEEKTLNIPVENFRRAYCVDNFSLQAFVGMRQSRNGFVIFSTSNHLQIPTKDGGGS